MQIPAPPHVPSPACLVRRRPVPHSPGPSSLRPTPPLLRPSPSRSTTRIRSTLARLCIADERGAAVQELRRRGRAPALGFALQCYPAGEEDAGYQQNAMAHHTRAGDGCASYLPPRAVRLLGGGDVGLLAGVAAAPLVPIRRCSSLTTKLPLNLLAGYSSARTFPGSRQCQKTVPMKEEDLVADVGATVKGAHEALFPSPRRYAGQGVGVFHSVEQLELAKGAAPLVRRKECSFFSITILYLNLLVYGISTQV